MINNPSLYINLIIHTYICQQLPFCLWDHEVKVFHCPKYRIDCSAKENISTIVPAIVKLLLSSITLVGETDYVLPTYSQRCHSQSPPWARQRWGWSTRHPRQGLGSIPRTKWVLGDPHVISLTESLSKQLAFFMSSQTCQISISITIRVFKGQGVHLGVRGKSVGVPKDQMTKCKLWIINDKSPIAYHK